MSDPRDGSNYRYSLYKRLRINEAYSSWNNRHLRQWARENGVSSKPAVPEGLSASMRATYLNDDPQRSWWREQLCTEEGQNKYDAWLKARYEGKKKMKPDTVHELQGFTPLKTMVDLSTAHVPEPNPDFGDLRAQPHKYGWIVFVHGAEAGDDGANDGVPVWLLPIVEYAQAHGAFLVNFDQDGTRCDMFQTWEW